MFRHYVYIHRRVSDGAVFYVGKGSNRVRARIQSYERAFATSGRNPWWKKVARKHGYIVEIVACCIDDEAAQQLEKHLIAQYGRANTGKGVLVNMTDGGDGHCGLIPTQNLKRVRSKNAKRPRTAKWIESIRCARRNGGNGGVVKPGDKLPESWRARIAAAKLGERNPMFGRVGEAHPRSRRVVDRSTGITYPSITAAAKLVGMNVGTLHSMLAGVNPNRTSMRFA